MGGWCAYLLGEQERNKNPEALDVDGNVKWKTLWEESREWLTNCLQLYEILEWEDEGIYAHAKELMADIIAELGDAPEPTEEYMGGDDEGEEWEEFSDDDNDAEMRDS